mgnify:CR=1 FL=1
MRARWIYGLLAVAALGAGGYLVMERPLSVTVVEPETNVDIRVYGLGTVEARILSRIGFEVGATLVTLSADAGDSVKKGQELALLYATEQEARVTRARAARQSTGAALEKTAAMVKRAQAVLDERKLANDRQQALARRDAVSVQRAEESQRDLAVARADFAVAEADVAVALAQSEEAAAGLSLEETLLAHRKLVAPYDARIVARHAELGTVVRAGDPVFTLVDPDTIWVQAYVDEERAGLLALGQHASIRVRSRPDMTYSGTVSRIGLESDRVNEERRVWLACADCPAEMYLGEQAEVRITVATRDAALMVPEVAIMGFDGARGRVWLVVDGKLSLKELEFGPRDDRGRVELKGGLPDGGRIVALPPKNASEGRSANIVEAVP